MSRRGKVIVTLVLLVLLAFGVLLAVSWPQALHPNPKDNPPGTDGAGMELMSVFLSTCMWVAAVVFMIGLLMHQRQRKADQAMSSGPPWSRNAARPPYDPARPPYDPWRPPYDPARPPNDPG